MSKVLYIKANAKPNDQSRTYKISDCFIETYQEKHRNDEIITLDLYQEGIPFLSANNVVVRKPAPGEGRDHPIYKYAYQFAEADKYVFAEPMWNLGIPAILKAYIDCICVNGITFKYTADGPVGLCRGNKVVNITARGGDYADPESQDMEMGDRYLRTIMKFLDIVNYTTISAQGLDIVDNDADVIVGEAMIRAQELAKVF